MFILVNALVGCLGGKVLPPEVILQYEGRGRKAGVPQDGQHPFPSHTHSLCLCLALIHILFVCFSHRGEREGNVKGT